MNLNERLRRLKERQGWSDSWLVADLYLRTGIRPCDVTIRNWLRGRPIGSLVVEALTRYVEEWEDRLEQEEKRGNAPRRRQDESKANSSGRRD